MFAEHLAIKICYFYFEPIAAHDGPTGGTAGSARAIKAGRPRLGDCDRARSPALLSQIAEVARPGRHRRTD